MQQYFPSVSATSCGHTSCRYMHGLRSGLPCKKLGDKGDGNSAQDRHQRPNGVCMTSTESSVLGVHMQTPTLFPTMGLNACLCSILFPWQHHVFAAQSIHAVSGLFSSVHSSPASQAPCVGCVQGVTCSFCAMLLPIGCATVLLAQLSTSPSLRWPQMP